jgi:hypothetical protein
MIRPVINRQTCSNSSARQKISLKLLIPLAIVSGTQAIGSIASSSYLWFVDSFLNEGGGRVKVRFRVVDFNLLCGIEGVALINQQKP